MSGMYSHITTSADQGVLVIQIDSASLNDVDRSSDVENEIDDAFQRFDTNNAVIDLQDVTSLYSVGLRIFVRMLTKSRKRSGRIILCNASDPVAGVLSLSKIMTIDIDFTFVPDRKDAIAALSSIENS